jgi:hypothetical protein
MCLWFEGQKAFTRLPGLGEGGDPEDIYVTGTDFITHGSRRVQIVGAAPVPVRTQDRMLSPLGDDYAVLKIDAVPGDLRPLPLAKNFDPEALAKLTPLIALGFPMGSRTQTSTDNVSATSGHVRRTFENMFQVDVSLHPGNSGGPFIDERGGWSAWPPSFPWHGPEGLCRWQRPCPTWEWCCRSPKRPISLNR